MLERDLTGLSLPQLDVLPQPWLLHGVSQLGVPSQRLQAFASQRGEPSQRLRADAALHGGPWLQLLVDVAQRA